MSAKYPGGFITKSPVAPTATAASGIWTVDQAMQYQLAGTWPAPPSTIVDSYFSSFALVGNGSSGNMYTGSSGPAVSLSTIGGLTWVKNRSTTAEHVLTDTVRGVNSQLSTSSTAVATTNTNCVTGFYTNQFTIGANSLVNGSGNNIIGWTFGRRVKFFDVVTYTGTGLTRNISHGLFSTPGCVIVKSTTGTTDWMVYHQSLGASYYTVLNTTGVAVFDPGVWNGTFTSTTFPVGTDTKVNQSGQTYIAYVFASDAGSFGSSGTENAITCGSFTTDGSGNATVTLGYEPQWIMMKSTTNAQNWYINDTMRGMPVGLTTSSLYPNTTAAESGAFTNNPTATGFVVQAQNASSTFIYIAVRKAMYTPSDYYRNYAVTNAVSENTTPTTYPNQFVPGFWPDLVIEKFAGGTAGNRWVTRLQGNTVGLDSTTNSGEAAVTNDFTSRTQYVIVQATGGFAGTAYGYVFKRGTGMMDIVCYTGNGTTQNVSHNLGAVPELMIIKNRTVNVANWRVYFASLPAQYMNLNTNAAAAADPGTIFGNNSTAVTPTSSVFTVGNNQSVNASTQTYIAYLWATVAGVSKVGTYTGTGTLLSIDCGFNSSTKTFVMIKRTDAVGDWYVFDTTQGMSGSNDPYWLMNSTAAQVTGTNYVDNTTAGFQVTAAASTTVNVSGATYVYLAIC